ncbi:MAG: hypothetical protein PHZ19_00670 [Candidatus Thermoplasmatota archaeon]|nr:hypothetical protein [Candidatus Thermoplasmatota archaeon]
MVEESNRKGQRLAAIAMIVFGFILWLAQRSANSFMEVNFFLIISLPTIALIIYGFIFLKFPEKLPVAMIVFGSIYLVSGFTFTYRII